MNKLETSFGSAEGKNNSARGLILAILLATTPAMAQKPAKSVETEMAMVDKSQTTKPNSRTILEYPKTPENQFRDGLLWINQSKTEEMRKKYWMKLAESLPVKTLENSDRIDSSYSMEIIRVAADVAIIKDPVGFLEHSLFCTDLSNYKELVIKAAKKAAKIDPRATLELESRYLGFEGGAMISAKAKKNLEARAPKEKLVKK